MMITHCAYAKINLSLSITGRRPTGYHELRSIVAFADVGERVSTTPSYDITLTLDGEFSSALDDTDNLILTIAKAFQQYAKQKQGAALHLHKTMPVASGIGGGSSDAAAALHCLNQLWQCNIGLEELQQFALPFGADIPACLYAKPCIMEGIGEIITPYNALPPWHIILVNPLKTVSTQHIFNQLPASLPAPPALQYPIELKMLDNQLQPYAIAQCHDIQNIIDLLQALDSCIFARMSGSGATCFAVFDTCQQARNAASHMQKYFPDYWVTYSSLNTRQNNI